MMKELAKMWAVPVSTIESLYPSHEPVIQVSVVLSCYWCSADYMLSVSYARHWTAEIIFRNENWTSYFAMF